MSERRRHLLVLLIVLGLIAGSAVVLVTQSTKLGLDLQGGVRLVYQGKPTKQTKVTAESLQRALDIMRDRVDAFGVVRAGARAHGQGPDRGQPAGRRGRRARRRPGRLDRPALLLRLGEERPRRELQDERDRDQRRPAARHRPLQRGQAGVQVRDRGAEEQPGRGRPALLRLRQGLQEAVQQRPARRVARGRRSRASSDAAEGARRGARGQARRARPARREGQREGAAAGPLLDRPRRPRAVGHGHQEPGAELRPARRQRADRHLRLHRQGPEGVPEDHRARSPSAAPTTPTR